MNIEKKTYGINLRELILFSLFVLVLINIFFIIITLVIKGSMQDYISDNWFYAITYPLVLATPFLLSNKSASLMIHYEPSFEGAKKELETEILLQQIEHILNQKKYIQDKKMDNSTKFIKATRLGQLFNHIINDDLLLETNNKTIILKGKFRTLCSLEPKLKKLVEPSS